MENRLKVYLSYSLQDDYQKIIRIKSALEKYNLEVSHYISSETYSTEKLNNADFVLFIIPNTSKSVTETPYSSCISHIKFKAGKGQYSEAQFCRDNSKPAFTLVSFYGEGIKGGELPLFYVSKLTDEFYGREHFIVDEADWKKGYGYVCSYFRGKILANLIEFVEGFFGTTIQNKGIVLTEKNKLKQDKRKLLLLIGK